MQASLEIDPERKISGLIGGNLVAEKVVSRLPVDPERIITKTFKEHFQAGPHHWGYGSHMHVQYSFAMTEYRLEYTLTQPTSSMGGATPTLQALTASLPSRLCLNAKWSLSGALLCVTGMDVSLIFDLYPTPPKPVQSVLSRTTQIAHAHAQWLAIPTVFDLAVIWAIEGVNNRVA